MQTLLTKKPQETHSSQTKSAGSESSTSAGGGLQESPGLPLFLQPKLAISQPDDPYEQEADRVAEQVMRMPDPASMRSSVDTARGTPVAIQRQCAACASGRQPCSACEEDESVAVSRKAQGAIGGDVPASVGSVLRSAGQPLAASSRAFFEPRFGQNLGQVRVHSDGAAQQSARDVNALAYTVGSHVVFGTGRYAPGTSDGQRLLAHELTHVVQQDGKAGPESADTTPAAEHASAGRTESAGLSGVEYYPAFLGIQRTADPDHTGPCDQPHADDLIDPAFAEARRWRREASAWLEAHLDHIRARGRVARGDFVTVGRRVYDELMFLERHFRISSVLRISLPYSADDSVSIADLERFGNASYWVRRRFRDVELSLSYLCQVNCPRGRTGSDTLGSAVAGSREVIFYTNCFDRQHETTRAGVALHEAFHATFSEFDHDTYSFEGGYPGGDALTNAESFAAFAAIVATGSNYRIIVLPDITIRGGL